MRAGREPERGRLVDQQRLGKTALKQRRAFLAAVPLFKATAAGGLDAPKDALVLAQIAKAMDGPGLPDGPGAVARTFVRFP